MRTVHVQPHVAAELSRLREVLVKNQYLLKDWGKVLAGIINLMAQQATKGVIDRNLVVLAIVARRKVKVSGRRPRQLLEELDKLLRLLS